MTTADPQDEQRPAAGPIATPLRGVLLAAIATVLLATVVTTAVTRPAPGWIDERQMPELRVDINAADAAVLQLLSGIGPALAERIVEERERRPFTDAEDLQRVSGIGPVTAERVEPYVTFGEQGVR